MRPLILIFWLVLYLLWPLLFFLIIGFPYKLINLFKGYTLSTDKKIEQKIKSWKDILEISYKVIFDVNPKFKKCSAESIVAGSKYKIKLTSYHIKEYVLVHELLHIAKGHCDLPAETNKFSKFIINYAFDAAINIEIIKWYCLVRKSSI